MRFRDLMLIFVLLASAGLAVALDIDAPVARVIDGQRVWHSATGLPDQVPWTTLYPYRLASSSRKASDGVVNYSIVTNHTVVTNAIDPLLRAAAAQYDAMLSAVLYHGAATNCALDFNRIRIQLAMTPEIDADTGTRLLNLYEGITLLWGDRPCTYPYASSVIVVTNAQAEWIYAP